MAYQVIVENEYGMDIVEVIEMVDAKRIAEQAKQDDPTCHVVIRPV